MASIFDVAKRAGVSKSTVSRVLNNELTVKEETKKRVEEAIKELNYSPSYFAQGIRTGHTKTIALLVPEYTNIFYGEMFRGIEDIALKNGYMILVCNTERHKNAEIQYITDLLNRNVDGIIYNSYHIEEQMISYLQGKKIPVVYMEEEVKEKRNVSYVFTDGFASSRNAVKYLFDLGLRRIGYLRNASTITATEYRYQGYIAGMKDCGLEIYPEYIYQCKPEIEADYIKQGMEAGGYYAKLEKKPEGIMTAIDLLGIGCEKQLLNEGIAIPEEISIIGYDNISLGEFIEPDLTTIEQPTREMGRVAAEILIKQIADFEYQEQVVFEGKLIKRASTK